MKANEYQVSELAEIFRLMGDASRLKIILAVMDAPLCVGDIVDLVHLPQTLVSHHLRLLKAVRLLRSERQGRHIFYCVADQHISSILKDMMDHISEDHGEHHELGL